jgi:ketosteroid isomerase-like protein
MKPVESEVAEANRRFYAAFESLEVERMEEVWLRESHISCVHPGWGPLFGWGPVMQSWQRIFVNTHEMHITLSNVRVQVAGDAAWVLLTENLRTRHAEGNSTGVVQATNIYERRGHGWFLVHHHGSQVTDPEEDRGDQLQ